MIWSIPIGWMNSLTQYVLIALDRQRQITGAFIVAVSFNIIANLMFLPQYSFRAAAITTIISEMVLFAGFALLIHRALGAMNWPRLLWRLGIASIITFLVVWLVWGVAPLLGLGLGPAVYLVLLWWMSPFDGAELARLSAVLPGRVRQVIARLARPTAA
ncbi:MAG: hypothetical protein GYB66_05460, partial [Chloroflexi bacterium]|nr:hypothetical protein [Chloroflexota bacterium]